MPNVNILIGRKNKAFIVFVFYPIVLFDSDMSRLPTRSHHSGGRKNLLCEHFQYAKTKRHDEFNLEYSFAMASVLYRQE